MRYIMAILVATEGNDYDDTALNHLEGDGRERLEETLEGLGIEVIGVFDDGVVKNSLGDIEPLGEVKGQ